MAVLPLKAHQSQIGNRQSAISNALAVAEGFEPSHGRINSAVPYRLGYATKGRNKGERCRGNDREILILHPFELEAMKGVEPLSSGLQDRRSCIQLSYIAR